jgi:hypothetical protein
MKVIIIMLIIVAILFCVGHFVTKMMHDAEVIDTTTETVVAKVTGKDRDTNYSPSRGTVVSYSICLKWEGKSETIGVDSNTYAMYSDQDIVELDIITYTLGGGGQRVEYIIKGMQQ